MLRIRSFSAVLTIATLAVWAGSARPASAQDGAIEAPPADAQNALQNPAGQLQPQDLPVVEANSLVPPSPVPATSPPAAAPAQVYRFGNPANGEEWVMTITPGAPRMSPAARAYADAYASVPYRHHEYLANPSYRHDTAVELVFGQLRPTVIQRQNLPERVINPVPTVERPYLYSRAELYGLYPRLRYGTYDMPYIPTAIP